VLQGLATNIVTRVVGGSPCLFGQLSYCGSHVLSRNESLPAWTSTRTRCTRRRQRALTRRPELAPGRRPRSSPSTLYVQVLSLHFVVTACRRWGRPTVFGARIGSTFVVTRVLACHALLGSQSTTETDSHCFVGRSLATDTLYDVPDARASLSYGRFSLPPPPPHRPPVHHATWMEVWTPTMLASGGGAGFVFGSSPPRRPGTTI